MSARAYSEEDARWTRDHVDEIVSTLRARLAPHASRFDGGERLVKRILTGRDAVISHGWSKYSAIDEALNEAWVAVGVLESRDPVVATLRYEPRLRETGKTIDFAATYEDGLICYIDVKTIGPRGHDRWEEYERANAEGWFPDGASVTLSEEWLGGQLWHNKTAARGRMLEYTLELENKAAYLQPPPTCLVLLLCSNGFHWHEDELEDFVSFYTSGTHRPDDPLAKMELRHLEKAPLPSHRLVQRFGYLERRSGSIVPSRMNWNVVAPPLPFA